MTYVQSDKQRLIVEDLFAFGPADFVLDPVLLGIPFIPLEAGAFEKLGQQILHESCIHQTYTTVKNGDAGLSCFSESVIMPVLGFQRKCPSPRPPFFLPFSTGIRPRPGQDHRRLKARLGRLTDGQVCCHARGHRPAHRGGLTWPNGSRRGSRELRRPSATGSSSASAERRAASPSA